MAATPSPVALHAAPRRWRGDERGQTIVLFVIMAVVLIGAVAIVTDVSWLWVNQQRMQRAADAAALAGAIYLPGDPATAYATARAEAAKNGYVNGKDGVIVTPLQDSRNRRRLTVTISGQTGTFFARVMCVTAKSCLDRVDISTTGRAEYVLPVPMGSPQNYYGVGYFVDAKDTTTSETITTDGDSGWMPETVEVAGSGINQWSAPQQARSNDNRYTTATTNGQNQQWTGFGLLSGGSDAPIPSSGTVEIQGIEVGLTDISLRGSGTRTSCRVRVELSWNGGSSWSTPVQSGAIGTNANGDQVVGSSDSTNVWGSRTWSRDDFSDSNFRVRLTWQEGTSTCAISRSVRLDLLEVRVTWRTSTTITTTVTTFEPTDVRDPDGRVLAPQNFWAAMQSQGAPSIQGDAYMTRYEVRSSVLNAEGGSVPDAAYLPQDYYKYAIEIPAGATGGEVWLFDPGFCDVGTERGTGENWTVGGANGHDTREPVSAYFDLSDTGNTPFDETDDVLVASSKDRFERLALSDHKLERTFATDCRGLGWHNGWWKLADGLSGGSRGKVYHLHTYSTDPARPNDQNDTTALNAFAVWATASGGTPRVYGYGAMEAYVRLPGGRSSEFYLSQIGPEHAGKTMVIDLWDPGDTGRLAASLQILRPGTSSYEPVAFSYTAEQGTSSSGASSCNSRSGTGVTSVTTNTGSSSLYNGCWLSITVAIPANYDAPLPKSDSVATEGGWWKIRYNISGSASDTSTDLTTWQVQLRGSPVHLVP